MDQSPVQLFFVVEIFDTESVSNNVLFCQLNQEGQLSIGKE